MPIFKKILLAMLIPVLPLLLFGIAFGFGLNQAIGSPEKLKEILGKSGVYENLIPNVLNNTKQEAGGEATIALSDPRVKEAALKAFTPQFVKQSSEEMIDGTFAWLNGEAKMPTFNIDLTAAKAAFASSAAASAEQRAATLPLCRGEVSATEFDVFSASCLPTGVTPAAAAARVQNNILNGEGFLEQNSLNAESLKGGNSNQSVFTQLENVPQSYQLLKKMPIYLTILAVLVATGIVFLSATKRTGIRRVGIILVLVGAMMLILSWILGGQAIDKIKFDDSVLAGDLKSLLRDLADVAAANYRLFGGLYTALGLGAVAGAIFIMRSNHSQTPLDISSSKPQIIDRDGPSSTTTEKPTPKPRQKKIQ